MPYGYSGTILHVDLEKQIWWVERRDHRFWRIYGGGGLAATHVLLRELSPGISPLSPENIVIFSSSIIGGNPGPGLARFSTCTKSPLTGGIGETRTEGPWGRALKCSGFDMIVLRGRSQEPVTVIIDRGEVRFESAQSILGMTVGEASDQLKETWGDHAQVAAVGPAGENLVRFASIVTERCYQASRMGVGAVLGSKKVKAVVLAGGEPFPPQPFDEARLRSMTDAFERRIQGNDLTRWQYEPPGFSCWVHLHGLDAALCVNNYSESEHPMIESYRKEAFLSHEITELGCPYCPLQCIKAIHPKTAEGDSRDDGIHQEAPGTLGLNLGIGDLEAVLTANRWCNAYGMDPASLGFTISCAMELKQKQLLPQELAREIPDFGDADGVTALIHQIAHRTGAGDKLAEGSLRFARLFGMQAQYYAMQVKGLELVPFEPRTQSNLALGYAVAPIGPRYDICEHDWDFDTEVGWQHTLELSRTLGILDRIAMNELSPRKVRNFKALLTLWSAADALNICIFASAPTRVLSLEEISDLVHAVTGWKTSSWEIMRFGERRLHLMRYFNAREGITAESDSLPKRFYREQIRGSKRTGDILDEQDFARAKHAFYAMMGWDERGIPRYETMINAHLEDDLSEPEKSIPPGLQQ